MKILIIQTNDFPHFFKVISRYLATLQAIGWVWFIVLTAPSEVLTSPNCLSLINVLLHSFPIDCSDVSLRPITENSDVVMTHELHSIISSSRQPAAAISGSYLSLWQVGISLFSVWRPCSGSARARPIWDGFSRRYKQEASRKWCPLTRRTLWIMAVARPAQYEAEQGEQPSPR